MIGVNSQGYVVPVSDRDSDASLQPGHPLDERCQRDGRQLWRRQAHQLTVGLQKAVQRLGAIFDNLQAAVKITVIVVDGAQGRESRTQAAGDGFDWRQGVVDLVSENADQSFPR